MQGRARRPVWMLSGLSIALTAAAVAGPLEKAKSAADPQCTVGKAAKGAARKATIGFRRNRCDLGETTRDTLGIDDRERDAQSDDGPRNSLRKN